MESRKVTVYEYKYEPGTRNLKKVAVGPGIFHQFGVNYEEFETGPGNYSTAIVEMPDGSVENVQVELIVFTTDFK